MGVSRGRRQGDGRLIGKWLATLAGVAPTLFAVTGVWAWIRSQRRQRQAG